MAATILSIETITEMVQKLGGLSLSPAELEGLAPQLETLYHDIQTLESIDLGEVEPETLFDIQGE
jgi:Asp-tRNA(Asn)/Glu-tRNA(Gln) amidotransferase C subunit